MDAPGKTNNWLSILRVSLLVLLIGLLVVYVSREIEAIREYILRSGWVGLLISLGVYGLLGLSPIPSEPLTIMLGTIYHPLVATLVAGTGNLFAAMIEYFIGERIGRIASFEERRQKLPFGLGRIPVNSVPFLLVTRMLPGYGPKFVSIVGGIYRVPLWRYLWTAAIPTFLGAAILAYGGFGLLNVLPDK